MGLTGTSTHDSHGSGTAGTANFWTKDQGVTSSPMGICRARGEHGHGEGDGQAEHRHAEHLLPDTPLRRADSSKRKADRIKKLL